MEEYANCFEGPDWCWYVIPRVASSTLKDYLSKQLQVKVKFKPDDPGKPGYVVLRDPVQRLRSGIAQFRKPTMSKIKGHGESLFVDDTTPIDTITDFVFANLPIDPHFAHQYHFYPPGTNTFKLGTLAGAQGNTGWKYFLEQEFGVDVPFMNRTAKKEPIPRDAIVKAHIEYKIDYVRHALADSTSLAYC